MKVRFQKYQSKKLEIMAACEERKDEIGKFKRQIGNLSQFDFVAKVHGELDAALENVQMTEAVGKGEVKSVKHVLED